MTTRQTDFRLIKKALAGSSVAEGEDYLVSNGDSLEQLRLLPDESVSLVLTDPPYHSTKKANIYGDQAFQEDEHFLVWMDQYAQEWARILKPSGTVYVFCSSDMAARLEVCFSKYMKPINTITWTKPNEPGYDGWKGKMNKTSLRRWYPHSERILVFEHGTYGTYEAYRRSPLGEYLRERRLEARISGHDLTGLIGAYGKVNHGGAVANWEAGRNIPSREQYAKIVEVLESHGAEPMVPYEDIVRPMNVSGDVEFTDVWTFMSVRPFDGKHPAEKPQDMLMHIIAASSYPGDVVLDCFAGSGSTGVAALRLGRRAVCIEIEGQWTERAAHEVSTVKAVDDFAPPVRARKRVKRPELLGASLFD
jgi:adenine-specific DNA-methyltransferase